jgi:hypothetical protein
MSTEQEVAADEPVRLKIEHRAYAIWEREGRPNGCDLNHWLQAEAAVAAAELKSESASKSGAQAKKAS